MAFPTAVNNQITDAVTQGNAEIVGDAPEVAMGDLYRATAQALANAAHNATAAQQQANITAQAATTMGAATLYSLVTASIGETNQALPAPKPANSAPREGAVSSQITDSIARVDAAIMKHASGQSTGMIDVVMAGSIGIAMYNAVSTQHNAKTIASAALVLACAKILTIPNTLPLAVQPSSVMNGENR